MIRQDVVTRLRELAVSLGPTAYDTEWHLFGSVERDDPGAKDIDLMIICSGDDQADALRGAIDPDAFALPLHLALLTFDEATETDAIRLQRCHVIFP